MYSKVYMITECVFYILISFIEILFFMKLFKVIIIKNDETEKLIQAQKLKIQTLEMYNKTLSAMYDKVKGFKHDFSNLMLALNGFAITNNLEGFKMMSKNMLLECKEVNKLGILDPKIIKNPAIYSVLTNKYYYAKEQNINMNIEILEDFDERTENYYQVCRIVGILLDNAIEAAKDTDEKIVNVRFIKDRKVIRKLIIIENSYNNKNVDTIKIFEKGYTSKESKKGDHGVGLWNIQNILADNENLNLYTTAGDLFKQQLEIY